MDTVKDFPTLVITGQAILPGAVRVSAHTSKALNNSDEFFLWSFQNPAGPIKPILDQTNSQAGQKWRNLVVAQSMDMFADSGMNGINWPAAMVEALGQVAHLSLATPQHIELEGLALMLQHDGGPSPISSTPQEEGFQALPTDASLPKFISLTMEDVGRSLDYASGQIGSIADTVDTLAPNASRTEQSMLASALLTLASLGRMTGYSTAAVGGPSYPWQAQLYWTVPEENPVLSGDVIDMFTPAEA